MSRGPAPPAAPRTAKVEEVVTKTLETTPRGQTHWSQRAGLSQPTIHRIWKRDVMLKLASGWPQSRLDELLPHRWRELHATAAAQAESQAAQQA